MWVKDYLDSENICFKNLKKNLFSLTNFNPPQSYISYTVAGVSVAVKRVAAITKELLGTFDLTVDGVKHSKVKATTSTSELLALLKQVMRKPSFLN